MSNEREQANRIIPNAALPIVAISIHMQGKSNRNLQLPLLPDHTFIMEGRRLTILDQYKNIVQTIIPPEDDIITIIPIYNMSEDTNGPDNRKG